MRLVDECVRENENPTMKITLTAALDSPQATCMAAIVCSGVLRMSSALNQSNGQHYEESLFTRYFDHLAFANEIIPLMPSLQARGYFIDKTK